MIDHIEKYVVMDEWKQFIAWWESYFDFNIFLITEYNRPIHFTTKKI